MEESEYMSLLDSVPADWYTSQESVEITKKIFYDILISSAIRMNLVINSDQELNELLEALSKERDVPKEEVIMDIQSISTTLGAIRLFNSKYPEIAAKFPKDTLGNPLYPAKFLAKVLEITETIAEELLNGVIMEYADFISPKNQ